MSLQSMLQGNWLEELATATLATPATHQISPSSTVATVASVAVANPPNPKAEKNVVTPIPNHAIDPMDSQVAWEADLCNAAMSEQELNVLNARLVLFANRGVNTVEAETLADRMTLRDQQSDERRLCVECRHISGIPKARRCSRWQMLGISSSAIPADQVTILQRCAGFQHQLGVKA